MTPKALCPSGIRPYARRSVFEISMGQKTVLLVLMLSVLLYFDVCPPSVPRIGTLASSAPVQIGFVMRSNCSLPNCSSIKLGSIQAQAQCRGP